MEGREDEVSELSSALDVVESVEDIKQLRPNRPWVAALVLLALIRKQISNEPLDYVYGVLGLLPDSCRARVVVDYSEESRKYYVRTYAQLFQALLEWMADAALMFLNNIETPPGAPSWCPELRNISQPGYSSFQISDGGAGCNPNGGGLRTPGAPKFSLVSANTISVRGAIVDSVAKVVRLVRPGKLWSYPLLYNDEDLASTCICFYQCRYAAKQLNLPLAAVARTLTGQTTRNANEDSRFANALKGTIEAFQRLTEYAVLLDAPALQPWLSDETAVASTKLLWSHWNGRSFFTTKKGRIGLGLRTTKPGDSVGIFFGAPRPYIMRAGTPTVGDQPSKQDIVERPMFKIVAECYVDGMMNGELFQQYDFEQEAMTF